MSAVSSLLQDGKAGGQSGFVYVALSPALGWRQVKIGRTANVHQRMNDKREFFAAPVQHAIEALDMLHEVMTGGRTH